MDYIDTKHGKVAFLKNNYRSKYGVVFLCGLASDMTGSKATYLAELCDLHKISFTRFDYFGHGCSEGNIKDGSVTIWKENVIDILKNVANAIPQILVGSSLGGWLMLLAALDLPKRVAGLIGIAPAPDFTSDMLSVLDANAKEDLQKLGYLALNRYGEELRITKVLLDDGQKNLVLTKEKVQIDCKVRLLHGMQDEIVPYQKSLEIARKVSSNNVELKIIKNADHNMKDDVSLKVLSQTLLDIVGS